jgi:hypothetical protein
MQHGNSLSFKKTLNNQGFTEFNHNLLLFELSKLATISMEHFHDIMATPIMPVVKNEVIPEPDLPVTPYEKVVFINEIPEQVRKTIRLRDDFPFLSMPGGCPDEFKILVHDMLSAYDRYKSDHKRMFDATTGEELQDIAASVVENYLENREIWDELNYFQAHGQILGKHPIFSTTDRMLEIRNMTIADHVKLKKSLENNIARTKKNILDNPEHEKTLDRKQKVAKWEVELVTVNNLLGINA